MIRSGLLEYLSTRASLDKFMHAYYGLSLPRKLWVMGYKGFMGYVGYFPASQLGRWDFLWVMGGYGLREVWVIRVSTVCRVISTTPFFVATYPWSACSTATLGVVTVIVVGSHNMGLRFPGRAPGHFHARGSRRAHPASSRPGRENRAYDG